MSCVRRVGSDSTIQLIIRCGALSAPAYVFLRIPEFRALVPGFSSIQQKVLRKLAGLLHVAQDFLVKNDAVWDTTKETGVQNILVCLIF